MIIPVFDELKASVRASGLTRAYLCREAGIGRKTFDLWMSGKTYCPRIDTMLRVARVVGRYIELTERVQKMARFYPPPKERMSRHDVRMTLLRLQ